MNKWNSGVVFALGLSVFLLSFSFVNASSGACSWHGGVDCAAGPGIYGQVICNDGWTGSSVSYDSMVECGGGTYDSIPSTPDCPLFSSYDYSSNSCKCDSGYVVGSDGTCTDANYVCHQQLGYDSEYDNLSHSCKCDYGYSIDSSGECTSFDSQCHAQIGDMSEYDSLSNTCKCLSGYILDSNGQCADGDTVCFDQLGPNSTYDSVSNQCGCEDGYTLSNSQCVSDAQPSISYPVYIPQVPQMPSIEPTPTITKPTQPTTIESTHSIQQPAVNKKSIIQSPQPETSKKAEALPTSTATTSNSSAQGIFWQTLFELFMWL